MRCVNSHYELPTVLQVAPTELEALLLSHADVVDAAVVGLPDVEAGELPMAFVVRRDGSTVTENQLQTFVAGKHSSTSSSSSSARILL